MKTVETYKGVEIKHDPTKRHCYYTEVIIKIRNRKGQEYSQGTSIKSVRDDIDKFTKALGKKTFPKVWVRGCYQDGKFKLVEALLFSKEANAITVRDKAKKITTISLTGYKFDEPKVFVNSSWNRMRIERMETIEVTIQELRKSKKSVKSTLDPYKYKK